MQNIELFDEYVARTLGMLYGSFPIRIGLDALQMSGNPEVDDFGVPIDERGKRSKAFDVCMATIEWLIDTGYIDCKERDQYGYSRCALTARGLEILKAVPASVQAQETIGEKLFYLIRKGSSIELAKEAAKAAIRAGMAIVK